MSKPTITINFKDKDLFSNAILNDIILKIFGKIEDYKVEYINRKSGKYITVRNKDSIKYVVFSATNSKSAHGNTFLAQPLKYALEDFFTDVHINKTLSVYLMSTTDGAKNKYNLNLYRILKSCAITILNEDKLDETIIPFSSPQEWSTERELLNRNQNNSSKLLQGEDGNFDFYGKMHGANQCDTFINLLYLSKAVRDLGKTLSLIPIPENKTDETDFTISASDLALLRNMGIVYDNISETGNRNQDDAKKENIRNQTEFKSNLFTKVDGNTTCAFCGYPVYITQAAHVLPVHIIEKKEDLSYEEKCKLANSAENGLYLCPNCHKLFDAGNITYFPDTENFFVKDDFFGHEFHRNLCKDAYKKNLKPYITTKFKRFMRLHNEAYNLYE